MKRGLESLDHCSLDLDLGVNEMELLWDELETEIGVLLLVTNQLALCAH